MIRTEKFYLLGRLLFQLGEDAVFVRGKALPISTT